MLASTPGGAASWLGAAPTLGAHAAVVCGAPELSEPQSLLQLDSVDALLGAAVTGRGLGGPQPMYGARRTREAAKTSPPMLKLHPNEAQEPLRAAQRRGLGKDYSLPSGVEGTIALKTRTYGLRQARYRGASRSRAPRAGHCGRVRGTCGAKINAPRQGLD